MFLLAFHSWELRAPRPAVPFCLIKKGRKNHFIAIRVRIRKTATTTPDVLHRAAARRRMSFMFGYVKLFLRFVPLDMCNFLLCATIYGPHEKHDNALGQR